jgi:hypothetical protein
MVSTCGKSSVPGGRSWPLGGRPSVRHLTRQTSPLRRWSRQVPGINRLTVGMIAAQIRNSKCRWIRSIVLALSRSRRGMIHLIELGIAHGGRVPRAMWRTSRPTWRLPKLLCRARRSSWRNAGLGGAAVGTLAPASGRGRCLALDEARSGVAWLRSIGDEAHRGTSPGWKALEPVAYP